MVVEADLADGRARRRRRDLRAHDVGGALRLVGERVRLVRVDADRKPHLGPELLDAHRLRGFLLVARRENHQRALEPGRLRARDDGVEVGGERLVGEMAVGIDHLTRARARCMSGGSNARPRRGVLKADEHRLAAVRARGEHHPVRLDAHQLRRLQVEDDDDRLADERFRLVGLGDAGDERALLGADVDLAA